MLSKRILIVLALAFLTLLVGCLTPQNQTPILTSDPITTAKIGVLYTYDVNATDPNGDVLTYSLVAKPTNMTINSATGLIKWTPVAAQLGNNSVTVKVSDGSLSITQPFTIKVSKPSPTPINHAPVIYSTPVTTATVGVTYVYDVNATDPDGDTLTYSLTTNPGGMAINPTNGLIWWVPTSAQAGNNLVTVNVSDGVLIDIQSFTIVVSEPSVPPTNQAPIIISTPITVSTVGIGYVYEVKAFDPEGDVLTYSLTTKPGGMAISPSTGKITWAPTTKGNYAVTVKVFDGVLSDTQNFTITVSEPSVPPVNQAPTIYSTPSLIATVDVKYIYTINAIDPNGDVVTYSLASGPTGMTFDGIATVSWTPTKEQIGDNDVTVKASDGKLVTSQNFTIKVSALPPANQAPVIYSIPNLMAIVGVTFTYEVEAFDPDSGDVLTYSLTDRPKGMTIESDTGKITWTPTSIQTGHNEVIVKVSDGDLSDTKYFGIWVDSVKLIGIEVDPKVMDLIAGGDFGTNADTITSVTAHYNDGSDSKIDFDDCTFTSDNPSIATVNFDGLVTAINLGEATITVTYKPNGMTFRDTIKVTVNPPPVFTASTVYSNVEHFRGYAIVWNNTAPESYPFENQVLVPFKTGSEGEWELHSIRLWGALGTANIRIYEDGHPIEIVEVTYGNVVKATWIGDDIEPLYEWQADSINWVEQEKVDPPGFNRPNKMYTLPTPVILDADTTYWLGVEPPSMPVEVGFSCYITESTYNPAGHDLTSLVMELFGGYWQ